MEFVKIEFLDTVDDGLEFKTVDQLMDPAVETTQDDEDFISDDSETQGIYISPLPVPRPNMYGAYVCSSCLVPEPSL